MLVWKLNRVKLGGAAILALLAVMCVSLVPIYHGLQNLPALNRPAKLHPIYGVETAEKKVAFSFDAAWGAEHTGEILQILAKHKVKTTFFLVGFWVDKYPEKVKQIAAEGHEIGNHSTTHPHFPQLSEEQMKSELQETGDKITALTKQKPELFRSPFGEYDNRVIELSNKMGLKVIKWSVDSLDWKEQMSKADIVRRVTSGIKPGSIVLFHNNGTYTAQALEEILTDAERKGFRVVPISQLIYRDNYLIDSNTGMQRKKRQ